MRALFILATPAALFALRCTPNDGGTSCSLDVWKLAEQIGPHVASKIPLDTRSDCSGYGRINNEQSFPGPEGSCAPDPSDDACAACLQKVCCTIVDAACLVNGRPSAPASCVQVPEVRDCITGAAGAGCAPSCGGAS